MSEVFKRSDDEIKCKECGHGIGEHMIANGTLNRKCNKIDTDGKTCKCPGLTIN